MEEWIKIKGFENYEISNFGRVRSLKFGRERILKGVINSSGYYQVTLCANGKKSIKTIHQLVAIAFLNHTPNGMSLVINHKDFNKLNNSVYNLEITTNRENTNLKHIKSSSQYTGVSWDKNNNKWRANICINKKLIHLGLFHCELEANNAYQKALSNHLAL